MKTEQISEKAKEDSFNQKNKCVNGCKYFTGGEIRHHKDCPNYPESFSEMYDELKEKLRWIPVEERLPEYVDKVLHIIAKNRVEELTESGFFKFSAFDLNADANLSGFKKYFTHWREIIE